MLQLLNLQHDHGLIDTLEQGIGKTGAPVEEATLQNVEEQELDQRPGGEAIEELLLMETTTVEVALEKGSGQVKGLLCSTVLKDLLSFEAAVGVVAANPVAEAL